MNFPLIQFGASRMRWNVSGRFKGALIIGGMFFLLLMSFGNAAGRSAAQDRCGVQKSEHFVVYFKNAPDYFVKSVIKEAEAIYRQTTYSLGFTRYKGWIASSRVSIYAYDDAGDYSRATGLPWSGASVSIPQRKIMTFPSANGFFDSTLPHELGHIIFRDFVGHRARVPLWLEEGVAVYQERAGRLGADRAVQASLRDGTFIPLENLGLMHLSHATPRDRVNLVYAESASVVAYMIDELETYRFVRLCRELKEGGSFERALNKAYMKFKKISDLEKAWKDALVNGKDN